MVSPRELHVVAFRSEKGVVGIIDGLCLAVYGKVLRDDRRIRPGAFSAGYATAIPHMGSATYMGSARHRRAR